MTLPAKSMTFDIDFSANSTPENDAVFAAVLRRAGGFAVLGAFEQSAGSGIGTVVNKPMIQLAMKAIWSRLTFPLGLEISSATIH